MNNTYHNRKFSAQELVFLISSFFCFAAALIFVLLDNTMFSMVFLILHGCLLLIFFLINHSRYSKSESVEMPSSQPDVPVKAMDFFDHDAVLIAQLRQEKDDLMYDKEQLNTQISKLKQENDTLVHLLSEAELKKVADSVMDDVSSILPPSEHVTELDLIPLATQLVTEMQPVCNASGIRLELSSSSSSIPYQADERYIRLLIRNIIDNSVKYMNRNGSLVITISNVGSNLFIAFKDNGLGLPLEEMPNIFELNYQGSNRVSGNGLGLAQVKAIVEHYHGSIYAHSENGMGIYIQLPFEC